ncbi:GlsB/YeaQ/YmgE family stress response membrane protein [Sphingomonas gilva]|uniref:GlsB/YeaQ/YmgE family stress response membrane protein n=1 Tax=Sphingomonas gilva TaxID=2305907 RepID=A0A396RKS5_9SPHN|nr:GlsB/YeaQ/YmgE family stress response membrane protein [Sphingomonas gilva]RHW16898.1 GlsB/YeaQ/YmgE family stress response membrane protein [Sphingomonas gilva]
MADLGFWGWILIGAVAGVIGKLIMPGKDPGGCIVTILLGIAGALLAGFVAQALGLAVRGWFATYLAAIAGAVVILVIYRLIIRNRRV